MIGALRPPTGVRLVELATRRRARVAYRRGSGDHPAVKACVGAIRAAADAFPPC